MKNNSICPLIKELERVCLICNITFFPKHGLQKFCSNKCSKKAKLIYDRQYNKIQRTESLKYHKNYYQKNKQLLKDYQKNYRRANRKKIGEKDKLYIKNRRITDINFKIQCNLRGRIYIVLKRNHKSARTLKLLGCSIEQLKQHLQNQFKKGMSWSNYGKWHVDHIKPCAKFNLSKPYEQKKCFNFRNLQPLWAEENRLKSDNIFMED